MHEVALVAELLGEIERLGSGDSPQVIRIRHASTIDEPVLQQAFRMLTTGSRLAETLLETEPFDLTLACACGFHGALGHDDLLGGSVAVCPGCGDVSTRPRTAELELLAVEASPTW